MKAEQSGERAFRQTKIWNRVFISVFAANAMLFLGMQMVNTLVAKYADSLGASSVAVGVVGGIFALTALLFKLVSGPAIDALDRRFILMAAIAVIAVSFFGFGISVNVPMLFGFRLLQGCGQAFTAVCCLTLAADSLPKEKFSAGIGTFTLVQALCQAIAPTVGLTLADAIGYRPTFFIAGFCTLLGVFVAAFIPKPPSSGKTFSFSLKGIVAKEAVLPAVLLFFLQMTFCNINAFLVIYADKRSVENIGYFFTAYAVAILIAPVTTGKLADKFGAVRALVPSMLMFATAFFLISMSKSLLMFLLSAVVSAFGFGAAAPAVQTICMKSVPENQRGSAGTTSYIGQDLGNLLGPVIAGWIIGQMGYPSMWRLMMIPVFIALTVMIVFRSKIRCIETEFTNRRDS